MWAWLSELFLNPSFMPHGHCYLWTPGLVWLQASSNFLIGAAYLAISTTLAYLVYRVGDLPFKAMYVAFGVFIITCGFTHFFDVWTIWTPVYWLDGAVRFVTAAASVGTALLLPPLVPKAIALARGAKAAHDRGIQLEAAVNDLARLYEKTRDLEQAKTQFFANVSHELRTPLALILGPTERLLRKADLDENDRWDLEVVARNARTLLHHVNDILDASKLEAGKLRLSYASVDLARLVRTVAANFDGVARERSIRFTIDAPESMKAEVDDEKVQRVLLNLLSNAFKFTPAGGAIRLALRDEGGRARLLVSDSGPGVPVEQRAAVFERFRQLDGGTTRQIGGTGLGLSIVKELAELHRGRVELGDAPEGGALFCVELPLRAPEGESVGEAATTSSEEAQSAVRAAVADLGVKVEAAAAGAKLDRPRALVVEDNLEMNRFVAETLGEDYDVERAADGEEALRMAEARPPDVVVSDLMMPRMSGDQLVAALRARPAFARVPILLLTAKADDELRLRLLREGAQDYVMKPFSIEELRARVKNLVVMKRAQDVLQAELEGQVEGLEALAREVSSKKRDLQDALEAMRIAREHALQASRAKGAFLSMVSHELRTPLTILRLHVERMLRTPAELSEAQQKSVGKIDASSRRLVDLIEALLEYARVEGGRAVVAREPLELGALVRDCVEELRPHAERKGIALTTRVPEPVEGVGDPRALRLVAMNLVENALKFTDAGSVDVEVLREGDLAILEVRDTGRGIPPEDRARVFEAFEQGEPIEHKHAVGIGLGLALVRQTVEAFGGDVRLESEVGRGSTFRVRLPLSRPG